MKKWQKITGIAVAAMVILMCGSVVGVKAVQIIQIGKEYRSAEKALMERQEKVTDLEAEIDQAERLIDQHLQGNELVLETVNAYDQRISELEREVAAQEKEMQMLQSTAEDLQKRLDSVNEEIKKLTEEINQR